MRILDQSPNILTSSQRRGAAAVMLAALLPVLVIIAAFTVNVAYIQLLRVEHKVATDAATRAAATTLGQTDDSASAIAEAQRIARLHRVGSRQFEVDSSKIEFGNAAEQNNGSFTFTASATPLNAVQVSSDIGASGTADPLAVPLPFNLSGNAVYTRSESSSASFLVNEVILCLDRSGSMKFDMSGYDFHYPTGNMDVPEQYRNSQVTSTGSSGFWDYYYAKPHPTDSRWATLDAAISRFFDTAGTAAVPPRVGLVTWSSSGNSSGTTTTNYALPAHGIAWNTNRSGVETAVDGLGNLKNTNGVFGGTQIASGLAAGLAALQTSNARAYSNKIVILLSDGQYQGTNPSGQALIARDRGVIVHCVALISGSAFTTLQNIATTTGGDAYMATNATQLNDAFDAIAKSLDTLLIK